jgi:hypothetical protein
MKDLNCARVWVPNIGVRPGTWKTTASVQMLQVFIEVSAGELGVGIA